MPDHTDTVTLTGCCSLRPAQRRTGADRWS